MSYMKVLQKNGTVANVPLSRRGKPGYTPVKGVDYFTEEDIALIVAQVIESLGGNPVFGYVDENNNIIVQGNLGDGTYSVKYEMEDGSTVDIGDLVLDTNTYYSVTKNLTNCTINNNATQVVEGSAYSATITANSGYELSSVSMTMGGSAVSVSGGVISIASVTGDIVITASATEKPVTPTYTNLATTFATGRLKSGGKIDTATTEATTCLDYIPFTKGTIVRIKGFGALTEYNCAMYTAEPTSDMIGVVTDNVPACFGVAKANASASVYGYSYDSASGVVTLTSVHANAKVLRVSGVLTGTTNDVIITVNENI